MWRATVMAVAGGAALAVPQGLSPYAHWPNGPGQSDRYFPIAVWLQNPANAARYQALGINLYVGLWKGPTEQQLAALKAASGATLIASEGDRSALEGGFYLGSENEPSLRAPPVRVDRTVADGGTNYYVQGDHRQTVPALYHEIVKCGTKSAP